MPVAPTAGSPRLISASLPSLNHVNNTNIFCNGHSRSIQVVDGKFPHTLEIVKDAAGLE